MTSHRVFISYSHRDRKWVEEIKTFLKPYVAEDALDLWDDSQIQPGEDWLKAIDEALGHAQIAVLLVSQYFLASDFIRCKEFLPLLERRGSVGVIWVLLGPCAYETTPLKDIQAANTDLSKSLSALKGSDRSEEIKRIAKKIHDAGGSRTETGDQTPGRLASLTAPARARAVAHPTEEIATLTVRVDRVGNGKLDVGYYREHYGRMSDASWHPSAADGFRVGRHAGLSAIAALGREDLTDPRRSDSLVREAGEILFHVLFPDERAWQPVLRESFGLSSDDPVTPARKPLRLRIWTDLAEFTDLPWALSCWNRRRLLECGWTFETVADEKPTQGVILPAPCRVLVVAPESGKVTGSSANDHAASLQGMLAALSRTRVQSDYFRVVRTRSELDRGVRGMQPHILYLYTEASADRGEIQLHLDRADGSGTDLLALSSLEQLVGVSPPKIVYLNLALGDDAIFNLGPRPLGPHVPAVVLDRRASHEIALAWLRSLLGDGLDPVEALGRTIRESRLKATAAASLTAFTNYHRWSTSVQPALRPDLRDHLRLDRHRQRAMVHQHIHDLVRSRRVEALIALAERDNLVEQFSRQALDHVAETRVARTRNLALRFPDSRTDLDRALEQQMRTLLEVSFTEPMAHALRRHGPAGSGPGVSVLWLDWGVFGDGSNRQTRLKEADLKAWLDFSCAYLTRHCPDDLRIVSYLAIETARERFPKISDIVDQHGRGLVAVERRFRCSVLDPLGKVNWRDLVDFLSDPALSTCPSPADFASLILGSTGGVYDTTLKKIEQAEQVGWPMIRRDLENEKQGVGPPVDDGGEL